MNNREFLIFADFLEVSFRKHPVSCHFLIGKVLRQSHRLIALPLIQTLFIGNHAVLLITISSSQLLSGAEKRAHTPNRFLLRDDKAPHSQRLRME